MKDELRVDLLSPSRNVMEAFLLFLAILSGIRLIIANEAPIDISLWVAWGWRVLLVLGPLCVAAGMGWTGDSLTARGFQQMGYIALGFGSLAYSVAAGEWVVAVFGVCALARVVQIDLQVARLVPDASLLGKVIRRVRN